MNEQRITVNLCKLQSISKRRDPAYIWFNWNLFLNIFLLSLVFLFYYLLLCCHRAHICTTHNAIMVCDDGTVNCVIIIDFLFFINQFFFFFLFCVNLQHKYGHWQLFTILELIVSGWCFVVNDWWWRWWWCWNERI